MDLKKWNEEVLGNIDSNKSKLLNDLREFDAIEESRALGSEEISKKGEVSRELEACLLMEEVSWRQKSRILWLKKGDKCTKYFHSMANSHRRYNSIDSLMIEGNYLIIRRRLVSTLSSFIKSFLRSNVSGGLGWMA